MGFQKGNKNGLTVGKSHAEGGIKMKNKSTNQDIELEGGEGVVNKKNMSDPTIHTFDGKPMTKCEAISEINSYAGNGVKIDCSGIKGKKYKHENGGMINKTEINEDGTNLPKVLQDVFDQFNEDADAYVEAERLRSLALDKGYDFDYGLSGEPTDFWKLKDKKFDNGGKTRLTSDELRERDKMENEGFKQVWRNFKRNTAISFGGDDISPQESAEFLRQHENTLNSKKSKRKYMLGGGLIDPHGVQVRFLVKVSTPTFRMNGSPSGVTDFLSNRIYQLTFLDTKGGETTFQLGDLNEYVTINNSFFVMVGYDEKFVDGGVIGEKIEPYMSLDLDKQDKRILKFLRTRNKQSTYSVQDKLYIEGFKGTNVANYLTTHTCKKIFGIMFQDKAKSFQISHVKLVNVGLGKLLAVSPRKADNMNFKYEVVGVHDTATYQNVYEKTDELICSILNRERFVDNTWLGTEILIHLDATIMIYPQIDPSIEKISIEMMNDNRFKPKSIGVGYAEFTTSLELNLFIEQVIQNGNAENLNTKIYKIKEGSVSPSNVSLIYSYQRL